LLDPKYNFRYIVGDTGTAYIGNDYFTDVVHRYSLSEAIEDRVAKTVRYVAEDSPDGESEKFQKKHKYYFTFLTPKDFDNFFEVVKQGNFGGFKSQLDAGLKEA